VGFDAAAQDRTVVDGDLGVEEIRAGAFVPEPGRQDTQRAAVFEAKRGGIEELIEPEAFDQLFAHSRRQRRAARGFGDRRGSGRGLQVSRVERCF